MLCAMFASDVGMLRVLAEHKADVNMRVKGLGGLATTEQTLPLPLLFQSFILTLSFYYRACC